MAVGRLARLFALIAVVIYQPLAALHFATSEEHIVNAATWIAVAHHAGHSHDQAGRGQASDPKPHHGDHQACDFCVLVGTAVPPLPAAPALVSAWHIPASQFAARAVRPEERLRIRHPVRAPPRIV